MKTAFQIREDPKNRTPTVPKTAGVPSTLAIYPGRSLNDSRSSSPRQELANYQFEVTDMEE
jgi:hypothetical protein